MSLCWIGDNDPSHKMILNEKEITSFNEEKRLGMLSYSKLIFDSHIAPLCKKAGQTFSAPARINHCLSREQKILPLNSLLNLS